MMGPVIKSFPANKNRCFQSLNKLLSGELWILICLTLPLCVFAVPISIQKYNPDVIAGNNSILINSYGQSSTPDPGCRYKAQSYLTNEEVETEEPCLRCQCKKRAVVCKLRICTERMPDAPPPGCVIVQKAKSCCPKLICPEPRKLAAREREQRLSAGSPENGKILGNTQIAEDGYCIHDGTLYAEGSAMKSDSPCDYCFCIRGEMKCSKPQCILPLNGCKPRYRSFACCPTNYDCSESNTTAILQTSGSSTTPIPHFLKGCQVLGRFIYEGEPVLPIQMEPDEHFHLCQTCYCLGGIVRCRPLECNRTIENCKPITEEGHCCPTRYDCGNQNGTFIEEEDKASGKSFISSAEESERRKVSEDPLNRTIKASPPKKPLANVNYKNGTFSNTSTTTTTTNVRGNESEVLSNKLKSDIGSREERRNKDKDDFSAASYKTSYEDDERDYLFGVPSLEALDHEIISKMTPDGKSSQKMTEPSHYNPDVEGKSKSVGSGDERHPSDFQVMENRSESYRNEIIEPTTVVPESEFPLEAQKYSNTTEEKKSTQREANGEAHHQKNQSVVAESNISFSSPETLSLSLPFEASTTIASTTSSTTTTESTLEFIAFGMEDALLSPPPHQNDSSATNYDISPQLPIKISYDRETAKASLIPPTPQNGYVFNPSLLQPILSQASGGSNFNAPAIEGGPLELKDNLRNAIMDVPVSTSLYNSGYYQNGIIVTNDAANTSLPVHVFDDARKNSVQVTTVEKDVEPKSPQAENAGPTQNPSRIYSKFVIDDSPSYRHETEGEGMMSLGLKTSEHGVTASGGKEQAHTGYSKTKHSPSFQSGDYDLDPIIYDEEEDDRISDSQSLELESGNNEFSKPISFSKSNETRKPILITSISRPTLEKDPHRRILSSTTLPTISSSFKPVVAFPFTLPKKPKDSASFSLGLKLSGCNIYGKMYKIGNLIRELSGPCVQCKCTETGVQCSEVRC